MIAVGVDAGGTSTVVAVSSPGRPLHKAAGPPANPTTLGIESAAATIVATVQAALSGAIPAAIHAGVAGAGRASVAAGLAAALQRAFPGARVTVGHDAAIALRSVVETGPAMVLVAGTGSVAYADGAQRSVLVGGHGYLLGDEGSAFALGLAAARHLARVFDGRAPRDETADIAARALGAADRDALHAALYDRPLEPVILAALAPSLIAFAGKGNRVATKIVQDAAKELGDLVRAAARGAGLLEAAAPIVLCGGLMRENSLLTFLLETRLTGDFTGSAILRGSTEPVFGALRLAERAEPVAVEPPR